MLRITFETAYHGRKTGRFGDSQHGYYYLRRSHYTGYYYRYAWNPAFKRTFNAVQQAQIDRFTAASNLCNKLWKSEVERRRYEALFARYQHIQMLHPTWQKETVLYVMGVISEIPKSGTNSRKRTKNPTYRTARQLCMSVCYLQSGVKNNQYAIHAYVPTSDNMAFLEMNSAFCKENAISVCKFENFFVSLRPHLRLRLNYGKKTY